MAARSDAEIALELGRLQPLRAMLAAYEASLVMGLAAHRADGDDGRSPVPGTSDTLTAEPSSPSSTAEVDGLPITTAHVRELLARLDAVCLGGLQGPAGGSLQVAVTDSDGELLATTTRAELRRVAGTGCGEHPAGATGQPAARTDLDHVTAYDGGGPTDCADLCCLCRRHHRVTTFAPGWRFLLTADGRLRVTTPSGVTRTTRPPGLSHRIEQRALPAPPGPPEDPPPF